MKTFNAASLVRGSLQDDRFRANSSPGEAYIKFQLARKLPALLSMKQVRGSMIVPADKITFMPSMPTSTIGITGYRDRVFCVFDLAQLLGFPAELVSPRQYQIIVLQTATKNPIYIGFAVPHLQSIVRLTAEQILFSLDAFPSTIVPYLHGAVIEEENAIPILEFERIVSSLDDLLATS